MPSYEVCLTIEGYYWTDVDAENEQDAEQYARDTLHLRDVQSVTVTDSEVKLYADS